MSDQLVLNGKTYVSSKRAASETGYARDYIGQLSRGGLIDAERVGGLWYVSLESLHDYEKNAEIARSLTPVQSTKEADSSLVFEGRDYISASRAAKLSGYNQDYVGQLARGGKIASRQIGNRWYVDKDALLAHKAEKDALLAAVQAESVGLHKRPVPDNTAAIAMPAAPHVPGAPSYRSETADLIPALKEKAEPAEPEVRVQYPTSNFNEIRVARVPDAMRNPIPHEERPVPSPVIVTQKPQLEPMRVKNSRKNIYKAAAGALTIILFVAVGIQAYTHTEAFAAVTQNQSMQSMTAAAAEVIGSVGDEIENWISPLLVYNRDFER